MKLLHTTLKAISLTLILSLWSCTSSGSDDGGGGTTTTTPTNGSSASATTDCGVVVSRAATIVNPINLEEGEEVTISEVVSSTTFIIERVAGPQLITLHGLSEAQNNFLSDAGRTLVQRLGRRAVFFPVGEDCSVSLPGGGEGTAGQLITSNGTSFAEELLRAGLATIDTANTCNSSLITGCYSALIEDNAPDRPTAGDVTRFIWKPQAERDGRLVVLADPFGAVVFVNGIELADSGPSNGFGTTARGNQQGCGFGNNARVEIFNRRTGNQYTIRGENSLTIPNGCNRLEFG